MGVGDEMSYDGAGAYDEHREQQVEILRLEDGEDDGCDAVEDKHIVIHAGVDTVEKFRAPVVDGADGKERDDEKERRNALKTKGVPECSRGGWLADGEDRREVGH